MSSIFCPECDHRLKLGPRPHKGQRVVCPGCEVSLVVIQLDPPEVELETVIQKSNSQKTNTIDMDCPECENFIRLSIHVREGYQIVCPNCRHTLQVSNTNPIELEAAIMAKMKQRRPKRKDKVGRTGKTKKWS